jgi:magnesium chelatase family protein
MDRIDIRLRVEPVPRADLFDSVTTRECSGDVRARVADAHQAAARRWTGTPWNVNGDVPGSVLRSGDWMLPGRVLRPAEVSLERGLLSARGLDRVLRLAWTIADLHGRPRPEPGDVGEALFFRTGSADSWAA